MNMESLSIYLVLLLHQNFIIFLIFCILLNLYLNHFLSTNVNGIVLLISNSTCSQLVYRKLIDFCISFTIQVCCNCLLVPVFSFLRFFFYITNHVICEEIQFVSSFPICICFLCFIILARISSTVLKRSGETEYLCCVSDLNGKTLSFSTLSMMLALSTMFFVHSLSQTEHVPLYSFLTKNFYHD